MRNKILYLFASLVMLSGCNNQPAYKDSSLSPEERAEDLLQQLTLEEKVALMMDNSKPVERLGIKPYIGGTKPCTEWHGADWPPSFLSL